MNTTDKPEPFVYWKRPWARWLLLAAVLLQLLSLWETVQEYREYQELWERGVFSASLWEDVSAQLALRGLLSGFMALLCLGVFILGCLVKTKRAARLAEGGLCLALAAGYAAAGSAFSVWTRPLDRLLGLLILGACLACGLYSLLRGLKREPAR